MIQGAIASASKHGIKLKHGTANPGTGDCAFEAVIQNNNDRTCYREKYERTVNWYRRIWATDMKNRARDSPYNIFTDQQWQDGWADMMIPGIYERGLFGDLMLAGIACGIKKILLIFNTNINTPHDPIYVVNPSNFNVQPDTEIPIVLAYNMSHYESMEPCTMADIQSTVQLVKEYEEGRYRYERKDINFLVTPAHTPEDQCISPKQSTPKATCREYYMGKKVKQWQNKSHEDNVEEPSTTNRKRKTSPKETQVQKEQIKSQKDNGEHQDKTKMRKQSSMELNSSNSNTINHEYVGEQKGKNEENAECGKSNMQSQNEPIDLEEIDIYLDHQAKVRQSSYQDDLDLCYKMKKTSQTNGIKEVGGKMECPFCKILVKNLHLHFERNGNCANNIDMTHFSQEYTRYKKMKDRKRILENTKRTQQRMKHEDPAAFNKRHAEASKKSQKKQKQQDPAGFSQKNTEAVKKAQRKQKLEDPADFSRRNTEAAKKAQRKQKLEDPAGFSRKNTEASKKEQEKQRQEDPAGFSRRNTEAAKKAQEKQKYEDPVGFNIRHREAVGKSEALRKTKIDDRQ